MVAVFDFVVEFIFQIHDFFVEVHGFGKAPKTLLILIFVDIAKTKHIIDDK